MRAELRDSLEYLYADSQVGAPPAEALDLDVARGGTVSAHVLLNGVPADAALKLAVFENGRAVKADRWFRLIDVPVEENTGLRIFTEATGGANEFVARKAPFRVYEAMQPVGRTVQAGAETVSLRVQIPVGPGERPGRREYTLKITGGGDAADFRIRVNVHKAAIPPIGKKSWPYTNWFSFGLIAERHGLKLWSEPFWRMLSRYAELMAHARQNTFLIWLENIFEQKISGWVLNRPRLRRIVKVFTDAGLYWIEGGHFASRTGGVWDAQTFSTLGGAVTSSPEGNAVMAAIGQQLLDEIKANKWEQRWIQHSADEPTDSLAKEYRILTGIMRKYMPGIPIIDATMDTKLAGSVDIWCPQCHEYQKHRAEFETVRKFGDRIFFYTCCCPGGPWLNRLMDQELLRSALLPWAGALFDLDGFLHWGLNHYRPKQDPFKQSVVDHTGNNRLPAGDTHFVYPGTEGPWSSLRLEAQREGTEDIELLRALKTKSRKRADAIIRLAIRGFDDYTKDVKTFRAARGKLLAAMSK